ncbi:MULTISPECIES: DUF2173 family protein [Persephonella]|uniref:Uncharacterized protein n=1 Tax=Persephonella marina (strain DSM 14350 / EX-H1) TaxID=123214 RepID=C0QUQ0_PERMH|nr:MULTISPECIES: DUF2173 family protein [Persephonella]ACO04734.1 hypothetical protein PERMA_0626 [Persephonella marina EX-H1]
MRFEDFLKHPDTMFILDKESKKVLLSLEGLPKDHERFIHSMSLINYNIALLEAEGWKFISGKYDIIPIDFCSASSEKYSIFFDDKYTVLVKTSDKLKDLYKKIKETPLDKLILEESVEAAGSVSEYGDIIDYKGDFTDEEIKIFDSIVNTNDILFKLQADMLSVVSGLIWYPLLGWFIKGKEHTLCSSLGKWAVIKSESFREYIR